VEHTTMLLTALTDEEFLRHAQAQHDTLVASAIETELLRRFASLIDLLNELEIVDHDALRHVDAVFTVAVEHDLDTPEALKKELERIRRFDSLMNDLTQPLKDLAELAPN
jgi:hypothetical protein